MDNSASLSVVLPGDNSYHGNSTVEHISCAFTQNIAAAAAAAAVLKNCTFVVYEFR